MWGNQQEMVQRQGWQEQGAVTTRGPEGVEREQLLEPRGSRSSRGEAIGQERLSAGHRPCDNHCEARREVGEIPQPVSPPTRQCSVSASYWLNPAGSQSAREPGKCSLQPLGAQSREGWKGQSKDN